MDKVGIIDYGAANIENVVRAISIIGNNYVVVSNPSQIKTCRKLILPGVGAFPYGMKRLIESGLAEGIQEAAYSSMPILGICLGMQLLFEQSSEYSHTTGLSLLQGEVQKLPSVSVRAKVPRFGWHSITSENEEEWKKLNIKSGNHYYFAHSYYAVPMTKDAILNTQHGPMVVCAGIIKDNIFGVQFHPEKSGILGHRILHSFLHISS